MSKFWSAEGTTRHSKINACYHMFKLVSIVILSFDKVEFTTRLLEKLVETRGDFETILVDNGSSLDTLDSLHTIEMSPLAGQLNLRCIFNDHNRGIASGRNQGADFAAGDCLLFLDNDVEILTVDWMQQLLQVYSAYPGVGVVSTTLRNSDQSIQFAGGNVDSRGRLYFNTAPGNGIRSTTFCLGACFLTPRHCWEVLGGFDTAYDPMDFEDVDYCLRAQQLGRPSVVALETHLVHRAHVTTGISGFARLKHYLSSGRIFRKRWEHLLPEADTVS
jgi:GT2 family glycosyltransferase